MHLIYFGAYIVYLPVPNCLTVDTFRVKPLSDGPMSLADWVWPPHASQRVSVANVRGGQLTPTKLRRYLECRQLRTGGTSGRGVATPCTAHNLAMPLCFPALPSALHHHSRCLWIDFRPTNRGVNIHQTTLMPRTSNGLNSMGSNSKQNSLFNKVMAIR